MRKDSLFRLSGICCFLLYSATLVACATSKSSRDSAANPYNLDIVSTIDEYIQQVTANPDMELVDLERHIPDIVLDIRYSTTNNFTGAILYEAPKAYARRPVAGALKRVQEALAEQNLGLKIFDAYRPYAATLTFYEVFPDTNFVADPRYGSRHNRGCAVDVTLVHLPTKTEIVMPTPFDDFTERSHPEYMDLPEEAISNRALLFEVMSAHGFTHYPTEWWHFDFTGWEAYPLMDLSFDQLQTYRRSDNCGNIISVSQGSP